MRGQKVYEQLVDQIFRFNGWGQVTSQSLLEHLGDVNNFISTYILTGITDQEALEIRREALNTENYALYSLPHGLQVDSLLLQTKKVLTIMELSENFEEFERLYNKTKKPNPPPPKDFDEILKSIFQIGKPPNEKKPPR